MAQGFTLDDYTMAAFISGALAPEMRRQVVQHLNQTPEARVWLKMATEALDAARAFTETQGDPTHRGPASRRHIRRHDRLASRRPPHGQSYGIAS